MLLVVISNGCTGLGPAPLTLQPLQFEPERNVSEEDNIEDISQNAHQNKDDQRNEESKGGGKLRGVCAATACLCQLRGRVFAGKSSAFCQQLLKVSIWIKILFNDKNNK